MNITTEHCQSCGACCQSRTPADVSAAAHARSLGLAVSGSWATCSSSDVTRIPKRHRLKLVPTRDTTGERGFATPQLTDGRCGFLRGTIGERVSCAIYEHRPAICRLYPAGSSFCLASRREIGLPA